MNKIQLPSNHKRSFSSAMQLLEKLMDEVETLLMTDKISVTQTVERDIPEDEKAVIMKSVLAVKEEIRHLNEKYDLKKQVITESRFLDSRKTKAWEILYNSDVSRMNAFGKFPDQLKDDYDTDIKRLLELVGKL